MLVYSVYSYCHWLVPGFHHLHHKGQMLCYQIIINQLLVHNNNNNNNNINNNNGIYIVLIHRCSKRFTM